MLRDSFKKIRPFLRHLLFLDVTPLIRTGRAKVLEAVDMPALPSRIDPRQAPVEFAALPTTSANAFLRGVLKIMRREVVYMALLIGLCGLCGLAGPLLVHELIETAGRLGSEPSIFRYGLLLAVALCAASVGEALAFQHYVYWAVTSSQRIANGLNARIYRQALALTRKSRLKTPTGDVVNYMGADTDAIAEIIWVAVELTYCVTLIVSVMALLFKFIGVAGLGAVAVLLALSPLSKRLAKKFTRLDDEIMSHRDKRVSQISQILSGIRIVKFFAWQDQVRSEIGAMRNLEVDARRRLAFARSISLLFYISASTLVSICAFGVHLALGRTLDAATVFACLGLFALLEYPFGNLTNFISDLAAAKVSAGRLVAFFSEGVRPIDERRPSRPDLALGVRLVGLTARYGDGVDPVLADIDLDIAPGESVAIVGPVGAGKSSLLLTILGEVPLDAGTVQVTGLSPDEAPRTAFVPQEAFVRNGSLRDNILFGGGEADLARAIRVASLAPDLAQLPRGVDTEIGEHGVNLSGGQKQRVCLARAVVARPGLALLDDPLSAVDDRTEDDLVEHLLFGDWSATTRIVVTHRLKHLGRFDRVVFLENGRAVASGRYSELLRESPRFAEFISETLHVESEHNVATSAPRGEVGPSVEDCKASGRITEDEDREAGAVALSIYFDYLKSMGGGDRVSPAKRRLVIGLLLATTLIVTVLPILQYSWLSVWTDRLLAKGAANGTPGGVWLASFLGSDTWNIAVYGLIGLLVLGAFFAQNLLWSFRAVSAGRILHDDALKATLAADVRFFDATPVGRILNRFSRDVDSAEHKLPWSFENTVRALFYTIGSVAVLLAILPAMIAVVIPVLVLFARLQASYRSSAREAQRLMSISRSPRFAHFKETLSGLTVIRAFHRTDYFVETFHATLAEYQRMFYSLIVLNRWFSVRVPLVTAVISLSVACGILVAAREGALLGGTVGLALTYALRFWEHLNWSVRCFSEVESRMTSVERLRRYARIPAEPDVVAPQTLPEEADVTAWPVRGDVEIRDLTVRYAAHLPDVLKDVSLKIPGGRKVGFIGRTGSGKSTLFQALFRFVAASKGKILIDGHDIAGIPLARLRRSMAIIPQDPTLFKGTLRENLDRFRQHDDDALWTALERAHLRAFVEGLPNGMSAEVKENGHNFSQGQRQLFCLARALLINARIIVLDEATASVDVETDALIQDTIRKECVGRTLLIIAHRLGTLSDCDMIVELDAGRVRRVVSPSLAMTGSPCDNFAERPKIIERSLALVPAHDCTF